MRLEARNLRYAYDAGLPVLKGIQMEASPGKITALVGPNASGKSTLLKCMAGILKPEGDLFFDQVSAFDLKRRDLAKAVSYLPQESSSQIQITVFEAVLLGRLQTLTFRVGDEDLESVWEILVELGIDDLAARHLNELSGGQKQTVSIAQALVRAPKLFLLDEPTNNLDLHHELEILDLITRMSEKTGTTTVIVFHDLNLAARYADSIVVLRDGQVFAAGDAESVLTPEMLRFVYRIEATVTLDEVGLRITPTRALSRSE